MKLDCRAFEELLEAFVDATLPAGDLAAARGHLAACPSCRELVRLAGLRETPPPGLAAEVLARTSGPACSRVRERLSDDTGAPPEGIEAELLRAHLADCVECAGLVRVLAQLASDLPSMAEVDPGESFVAEVLRRTSGRPGRFASVTRELTDRWQRLLRRPRFAFEGAYVLTLVVLLVFGVPASLVSAASRRAGAMAPVDLPSRVERSVTAMGSEVSGKAREAWKVTSRDVEQEARQAATDLVSFGSGVFETFRMRVGTFWSHLASAQTSNNETRQGDDAGRQDGDER